MDMMDTFRTWAAACVAEEVIGKRKAEAYAALERNFLDEVAKQLYAKRRLPGTLRVECESNEQMDHLATFVFEGTFRLDVSGSKELLSRLKIVLGDNEGQRLFDNEVDTTPLTILRPFDELLRGHFEGTRFVPATAQEQQIATKLVSFLQGQPTTALTDVERELALVHQPQMKVKPDFLDRAATYCKSVTDLQALLQIIVPIRLKSAKFGISDTPKERNDRIVQVVIDVLGESDDSSETPKQQKRKKR